MAHQPQAEDLAPRTPSALGIFLPSMTWTTDRETVEQEVYRLLIWQALLGNLVDRACDSDQNCTWYLMAEAAVVQIARDRALLCDWLQALDTALDHRQADPKPN